MRNILRWIRQKRFPYEPLISVEINKSNLLHNLHSFQSIAPNHLVAPVLKSNAYGHGLLETAKILQHQKNIPFLIVDSYFEAIALRSKGIKTSLLIIGFTRPDEIINSKLRDVIFTVGSIDVLQVIEKAEKEVLVNLKIDTGMHRQGILPGEVDHAIELIDNNDFIRLESISSHFSDADNEDPSFTEEQIFIWNRISKKIENEIPLLKYKHISATDGHIYGKEINANVSRLGIGLYGINNNPKLAEKITLKPVMKMKTVITGIKHLMRDEYCGYGNTFKAHEDMKIATIPVGYYEGLDRRLSNVGFVQVGKVNCPIIGRVSMNIATIDVTKIKNIKVGDEVIVISNNVSDPNSLVNMSKLSDTITYELAVHIPAHLKRNVTEE